MNAATWLTTAGTLGVALSAAFAGWQIRVARKQATTAFEDTLAIEYRALVKEIPVAAFLEGGLSPQEIETNLGAFYRYFDLSNEQAFLADEERISSETWSQWADGINQHASTGVQRGVVSSHQRRGGYQRSGGNTKKDFDELRRLLKDRRVASLVPETPLPDHRQADVL